MNTGFNLFLKGLFLLFFFAVLPVFGQSSNDNPKWIAPAWSVKIAYKNQGMELGFYLKKNIQDEINKFFKNPDDGLNPYDPDQINFSAIFTSPTGRIKQQYGFYFEDYYEDRKNNKFIRKNTKYPWRVRFAPDEVGKWTMTGKVEGKFREVIIFEFQFSCENSDHKGPLTITNTETNADRYLSFSQSGESFIPISINLSNCGPFAYEPFDNNRHMRGIEEHASVGGNFSRFEIGAQNGLPDWQDMRNYDKKQDEMFAYDRLLKKAEDHKMYYIIFRHHVEICGPGWGVSNWNNNPYRKAFDLQKQSEYFTNPEVIKWQKNNLRYMYSRWGYSPYWTFYGYSELELFYKGIIEQEGLSEREAITLFNNWFIDQKNYIKTELKPDEMFSNSYGKMTNLESKRRFNGFFKSSDVISLHNYNTLKKANYEKRYDIVEKYWDLYKKPVILEEMGINDDKLAIYCCTKSEFHNSIWATAFMGDFGTGLDWWWDRGVMDFNYHQDFIALSAFLKDEDFKKMQYYPQRWTDSRDAKRTIESFQLISEKQEKIIGWLHNATYYWRNIAVNDTCLQSLIDSSNLSFPCFVGSDTYLGKNDSPRDYARDIHEDKYTSKGGFQPISNAQGIKFNPIFKVENIKSNRGKKKYWYKVEFYSTQPNAKMAKIEGATQIVRANFFNDLVIHVPNLDANNPDVAFKITLLEKEKSSNRLTP